MALSTGRTNFFQTMGDFMRLMRCLLVSGSAAMLAGGMMLTAGSAATVTAAPARAAQPASHYSAHFVAEARSALVHFLSKHHQALEPTHQISRTGPVGTTDVDSFNWSGYADSSATTGTFSQVSAEWKTPFVACNREDTITSEWVGLDGFSSDTVEQDGTLGWCFEGSPIYFTWYEMFPAGTIEVGTSLQPNDIIKASVSRTGTSYTLAVTDFSRPANSFSVTSTCAAATCLDTSAEWIAERPSFSIGIAPLADYGIWRVSGASETAAGVTGTISSYPTNDQIGMVDATDTYELSVPSSLVGGSSFSTLWQNSY